MKITDQTTARFWLVYAGIIVCILFLVWRCTIPPDTVKLQIQMPKPSSEGK